MLTQQLLVGVVAVVTIPGQGWAHILLLMRLLSSLSLQLLKLLLTGLQGPASNAVRTPPQQPGRPIGSLLIAQAPPHGPAGQLKTQSLPPALADGLTLVRAAGSPPCKPAGGSQQCSWVQTLEGQLGPCSNPAGQLAGLSISAPRPAAAWLSRQKLCLHGAAPFSDLFLCSL